MIVNDINYLEVSNEEIIGGVVVPESEEAEFDVDLDVFFNLDIDVDLCKIPLEPDSSVKVITDFDTVTVGLPDYYLNLTLVVTPALIEPTTIIIGSVA